MTGSTACGKTFTLAALIDLVNTGRAAHVVTIEERPHQGTNIVFSLGFPFEIPPRQSMHFWASCGKSQVDFQTCVGHQTANRVQQGARRKIRRPHLRASPQKGLEAGYGRAKRSYTGSTAQPHSVVGTRQSRLHFRRPRASG